MIEGKRPPGRPRNLFIKQIKKDLGSYVGELEQIASDRLGMERKAVTNLQVEKNLCIY